jgi:hypothetical protein
MRTRGEIDGDGWEWIWDEDPAPEDVPTELRPEVPEPKPAEDGEERDGFGPEVLPRRRLRAAGRGFRFLVVVAVAAALGTAIPIILAGTGEDPPAGEAPNRPAGAPSDQLVVVWTVWGERPQDRFVTVLAAGGGRAPVAVTVPGNTTATIPGRGLGTVDDAAGAGDVTVVQATVQNLLGVEVDEALGTPLAELRVLIDRLGGVTVGDRTLDGDAAVRYMGAAPPAAAIERMTYWQEVLRGLLGEAGRQPEALGGIPAPIRPALAAGPRQILPFPVEDIGADLARPDPPAVEELVRRWFVAPSSRQHGVRLMVLNGNGEPGIGEEVARILVPEGFVVVDSDNYSTFDVPTTKVIATTGRDLPAARAAHRLLGVGEVFRGSQYTGLADVTIIVGDDFGSA